MQKSSNSGHYSVFLRFDFDKFISAIQDVKQGVNERLRQWAEYEAQLEKLVNWLGDSEAALKNYCHKSSMEEKQEQVERFKVMVFSFALKCIGAEEYSYFLNLKATIDNLLKRNLIIGVHIGNDKKLKTAFNTICL